MALYTYDDFTRAANNAGLMNEFSASDLLRAQTNPDYGMSILNDKIGYHNARTPEEAASFNRHAEGTRSSWGEYTGGTDGSGFYLNQLSPSSFSYGPAPTYQNQYNDQIQDLLNQQLNYGSFSYGPAPTYNNRYDDTIQDLLNQVINRDPFSYDASTDPLYSQYRKQYVREGQRATADALAAAAAASGGIPSSYASTAAGQAANYYAAQMTDKIPELYQLAYNKYLNDYNMKLSDLNAVQGAERSDYDKYLGQLNQYNTDRDFDYRAWLDQYNMINNNLQTANGLAQQDYDMYLNELNQYNIDRNFNYGQLLDEIDSQTRERQEALNNVLLAAEYGDLSGLNRMGINTNNYVDPAAWERAYQEAVLRAEYLGDYSLIDQLTRGNSNGGVSTINSYGYDTHGYTEDQIRALQAAAGIATDGIWGPDTERAYQAGARPDQAPASSNSTTSKTRNSDPNPQPDTTNKLSATQIAAIRNAYGDSLTQEEIAALRKNNPYVTDAMLRDAGFAIQTNLPQNTTANKPEAVQYTDTGTSNSTYNQVATNLRRMKNAGVQPAQLGKALDEALSSGAITQTQYNSLKREFFNSDNSLKR